MKLSELQKHIPIVEGDVEVDPTDTLEHHFFGKHYSGVDYRDRAINFAIERRLPVTTTQNNGATLIERFVKVACPVCGADMARDGATGNGESLTTEFRCDHCGVAAELTIPTPGGITFIFRTV